MHHAGLHGMQRAHCGAKLLHPFLRLRNGICTLVNYILQRFAFDIFIIGKAFPLVFFGFVNPGQVRLLHAFQPLIYPQQLCAQLFPHGDRSRFHVFYQRNIRAFQIANGIVR